MEIKHVYISDLNTHIYLCKENTKVLYLIPKYHKNIDVKV